MSEARDKTGGREKRTHKRTPVLWSARLDDGVEPIGCQILNLSAGGAKIRVDESLVWPTRLRLKGAHFGELCARIVWRCEDRLGLAFLEPPKEVSGRVGDFLPEAGAAA